MTAAVTVRLLKPGKGAVITYEGQLLHRTAHHALLRALWSRPRLDLGYVVFEPGDVFFEHFFADRWFTIFEIRDGAGGLKGWYCNIARPAQIEAEMITSEDLEIDLFVSADRRRALTLDLDEFEARRFEIHDPAAHAAALAALGELRELARMGAPPFDQV